MKLRLFTKNESQVLSELKKAYGQVSAEVFFNPNEIRVLKFLMNVTDRKNVKSIMEETELSRPTTKKTLNSLEEKGAVSSEVNGLSCEYWCPE